MDPAPVQLRFPAHGTFRLCVLWGIGLLIWTAVMGVLSAFETGPLPPGYRTPILAFELASSPAEVEALFAEPGSPRRAAIAAAMDRLNLADFVFLAAYGGFVALFALAWLRRGARPAGAAAALALLSAAADAVENLALLRITASLGGEYDGALRLLSASTWTKWIALPLAFALLAPALVRHGRAGPITAALFCVPLPLAIGAWLRGPAFAEPLLPALGLAYLAAFAIAAIEWRREATHR